MDEKARKAEQLRKNKIKGKMGEFEATVIYNLRGYDMERDPKGKDFVANKRDPLNPNKVIETKNVEVKTGKSKLSPRQKITQEEEGLEIYRTSAFPYNLL
jgi:hypothetical protein